MTKTSAKSQISETITNSDKLSHQVKKIAKTLKNIINNAPENMKPSLRLLVQNIDDFFKDINLED